MLVKNKNFNGVSVVIPTYYEHIKYLRKLLESLDKAINYFTKKFNKTAEIVVVDTSLRDEIKTICVENNTKYYRAQGNLNIARNTGIENASYEIILFIDSDCEVTEDLICEHYSTYLQNNNEIGGVLGLTLFVGKDSFAHKVMTSTPFITPFGFANITEHAPWGTFTNISFNKNVLNEVGRCDKNWPLRHGGEDVDLGWKVTARGYHIISSKEAVVYHRKETWSSFKKNLVRTWVWGRADFYLLQKFPQKSSLDLPKYSLFWVIIPIVSSIIAIFFKNIYFLLLIPASILLPHLIDSSLKSVFLRESGFLCTFLAELFFSVYEFGFICEGFKNGSLKPTYVKLFHPPGQLRGEWATIIPERWWKKTAIKTWTLVLTLFILGFLFSTIR